MNNSILPIYLKMIDESIELKQINDLIAFVKLQFPQRFIVLDLIENFPLERNYSVVSPEEALKYGLLQIKYYLHHLQYPHETPNRDLKLIDSVKKRSAKLAREIDSILSHDSLSYLFESELIKVVVKKKFYHKLGELIRADFKKLKKSKNKIDSIIEGSEFEYSLRQVIIAQYIEIFKLTHRVAAKSYSKLYALQPPKQRKNAVNEKSAFLMERLLTLWVAVYQKRPTYSRSSSTGRPTGPLVRFISKASELVGYEIAPEKAVHLIKSWRRKNGR